MTDEDKDFKGANEIGRIYDSFHDKKLLCDFFIDSVLAFIKAKKGYLFLVGNSDQLWLESSTEPQNDTASLPIHVRAPEIFTKGQTLQEGHILWIPLIVRNAAIGLACFVKESTVLFTDKDFSLALDLTSQLAGSLKNIILFEQNIKMERLAAMGQTLSMVMHELTNILQLGKLSDECLRRGIQKQNETSIKRGLDGLSKALRDMEGFTYEMLSLTKDYKIKPDPMDMGKLLAELKADLDEKAAQARVSLDFAVEGELAPVQGESRSLYRALLNMVKNALEAADKQDAFIRIRARSLDQDQYEIVIQDNGQGMPPEVKAQIFQAFFSTKGERGTGLGLIIIDKTIKAHQGKIHLDSEPGKGTCFTLTLPKKLSIS